MKCISQLEPDRCTGCGACMQSCPVSCIEMKPDRFGFLHPEVSQACIHCGKCVSVCPAVKKPESGAAGQTCYLAEARDRKLESGSASGGFCACLASHYLKNGNASVFGAVTDENFRVHHRRICSPHEIPSMQGSMYVQSSTDHTYEEVLQLLKQGQYVIYTGTPCQIAGLKKFLGKDYEKLILVDLICHGVPSPAAFQKYTAWLSDRHGSPLTSFRFRTKTSYDRAGFLSTARYRTGRPVRRTSREDIFFFLFAKGLDYRRSCYACPFAGLDRQGDFTCGDCGSRASYSGFRRYEAGSAVILNTDKARKIWPEISGMFYFRPIDLKLEAEKNHTLHACTPPSPERDRICTDMLQDRWQELADAYLPGNTESLPRRAMHKIPIPVKKMLLRMMGKM